MEDKEWYPLDAIFASKCQGMIHGNKQVLIRI